MSAPLTHSPTTETLLELLDKDIECERIMGGEDSNTLISHLQAVRARAAAHDALAAFHDAWVEAECAQATGDPQLAKVKRIDLVAAHKTALAALAAVREMEK